MPFASVNGINLCYEVEGDGPPVLFIHGLGSSLRDWTEQTDVLRRDFSCITYDARGHGRSDKPLGPYSVCQHAADAVALLDHLGIESAFVVGLSMGGMIAFQMAVDSPQRISGMAILNSGPHLVPQTLSQKLQVWQRLILCRLFNMRQIARVVSKRLFPEPHQQSVRKMVIERWSENDKRAYLDAIHGLLGWSVMPHIGSIDTPTLVIAADQDYTPVALKRAYVEQMPNAQLTIIENARHAVNIEYPEHVNDLLVGFMSQLIPAPTPITALLDAVPA